MTESSDGVREKCELFVIQEPAANLHKRIYHCHCSQMLDRRRRTGKQVAVKDLFLTSHNFYVHNSSPQNISDSAFIQLWPFFGWLAKLGVKSDIFQFHFSLL